MHCITILYTKKHACLQLSQFKLALHELYHFEKNVVLNMLRSESCKSMHVKYIQDNFTSYDMVYQYVHDNNHGLTIYVNFMVKCVCVCVLYGPWIQ
jgi:hypothetical protein